MTSSPWIADLKHELTRLPGLVRASTVLLLYPDPAGLDGELLSELGEMLTCVLGPLGVTVSRPSDGGVPAVYQRTTVPVRVEDIGRVGLRAAMLACLREQPWAGRWRQARERSTKKRPHLVYVQRRTRQAQCPDR